MLFAVMGQIHTTQDLLELQVKEAAREDTAFRLAKAKAFMRAEGPQTEKEQESVLATADLRAIARIADGHREATVGREAQEPAAGTERTSVSCLFGALRT